MEADFTIPEFVRSCSQRSRVPTIRGIPSPGSQMSKHTVILRSGHVTEFQDLRRAFKSLLVTAFTPAGVPFTPVTTPLALALFKQFGPAPRCCFAIIWKSPCCCITSEPDLRVQLRDAARRTRCIRAETEVVHAAYRRPEIAVVEEIGPIRANFELNPFRTKEVTEKKKKRVGQNAN